jgi:hypothetical protein
MRGMTWLSSNTIHRKGQIPRGSQGADAKASRLEVAMGKDFVLIFWCCRRIWPTLITEERIFVCNKEQPQVKLRHKRKSHSKKTILILGNHVLLSFLSWQFWCLNSGPQTCEAGATCSPQSSLLTKAAIVVPVFWCQHSKAGGARTIFIERQVNVLVSWQKRKAVGLLHPWLLLPLPNSSLFLQLFPPSLPC